MNTVSILTFISALSFLFFGTACFFAPQMKIEFKRYGLANYRRMVGILQLMGAGGLLLGHYYSTPLQATAAGGLSVLMFLGFAVRLKIRDSFFQAAPSFTYAVLNGVICYLLLNLSQ